MTSPASIRCVANLWRQGGKQIDVTHERGSLGSSTYLQKCRMYAPPSFCKRIMKTSIGPGLSFVAALLKCIRLKLRPTIHRNTCLTDPPSTIRGEECDYLGNIVGFADSIYARLGPASVSVKLDTSGCLSQEQACFTRVAQLQHFETASGCG
jgi:hypothetical protein